MSAIAADVPRSQWKLSGYWMAIVVLMSGASILKIGSGIGETDSGEAPISSECEGQSNLHYIRAPGGSYGSENGSDWTNAFDGIPSALTRGHSYYIADGAYSSYTANDAQSGTTVIRLCKATADDHGTETGWDSTFGDGQATFTTLYTSTPYWVIDGARGDGSTSNAGRTDPTSYGFYMAPSSGDAFNYGGFSDGSINVTAKHIAVECAGSAEGASSGDHQYAFHGWSDSFTLSYSFVSNCQVGVWNQGDGLIVEYTAIIDGWSLVSPSLHGVHIEVIDNPIIRFNFLQGCPSQCIEPGGDSTTTSTGGAFYGNIIKDAGTPVDSENGFMVGVSQSAFFDTLLYNNTMVGGAGPFFTPDRDTGVNCASGNIVQNNILFDVTNGELIEEGCGDPTIHDYNTSYDTPGSISGEANGENLSGDPFVNSAADDYHLASGTTAGVALGSPYNVDMDGVTRSTPDRGAFEF